MSVFIEKEIDMDITIPYEDLANRAIEQCLSDMGCPYEAEVNLVITDNEGIKEVNLDQRNLDKATDVLSFPFVEWEEPNAYELLENSPAYFNPDTGELMLGDIMLSYEKVQSQALEYGHSLEREYSFLIVHSMLHLLGFDHMDEEDKKMMEAWQEKMMSNLGILR